MICFPQLWWKRISHSPLKYSRPPAFVLMSPLVQITFTLLPSLTITNNLCFTIRSQGLSPSNITCFLVLFIYVQEISKITWKFLYRTYLFKRIAFFHPNFHKILDFIFFIKLSSFPFCTYAIISLALGYLKSFCILFTLLSPAMIIGVQINDFRFLGRVAKTVGLLEIM